jgi:hypothetical protein
MNAVLMPNNSIPSGRFQRAHHLPMALNCQP